ncbi:hypothetical protein [Halomicrococcus sp. NG-SE-24]|uniref:hypothetical protein n=1 Tax=Halomicrococcus sp. NG-SE-24 TaxID=3436928 RepID=UPI003D95EA7C
MTSLEEFEDTLSALVATTARNDVEVNHSLRFCYDNLDYDDMIVEISQLAKPA